ncbi:DUF4382 domain-containing protein [Piscinibacter sp.]|jgi:hypothetical protein|uniref:DUF4382 domain-containing protein n=1 Tax=Piscinibacter sp. TaxID=1903157 RepID=UPI00355A97C1
MIARRTLAHGRTLLLALWTAALVGCGGGASSGGGVTPAPGSQTGALSLGLAGGAHTGVDHVWVTVSAIALHTDADRAWSAGDTSWQVFRLDTPITIDLAAVTNGLIASVLTGKTVPAASYAQLRLFVLRHDDALADSAKTLNLLYNAQVARNDGAGVTRQLPLEFADAGLGLRVDGPVVIGAGVASSITLQWDLQRSLVRFAADDGVDRVTMRPELRAYDLANTGAIVGVMDKSLFCAAGVQSGCVHDVVASAQLPSADGLANVSVRATPVVVGDTYALFALYPLPVSATGQFDVVIQGRNMQTMLVRAVPASAADLLAAAPTQLGADPADPAHPVPMALVLSAAGDSQASLAQAMAPRGAQLLFGQTLPGSGERAHELVVANTDPFTGRLAQPLALPSGPLRVATYSATTVLSFSDVTPQEGSDSFTVLSRGTRYDDPGPLAIVTAPGGGSVSFVAPNPLRKSGLVDATLAINLSGGSTQQFDAAELVVADVGGIVTTQDVSALIGAGGQVTLTLPAGANAAALGGTAVYSVSVRTWRRAAAAQSLQWARASAVVDLRSASAASVTVSLP